MKQAEPAPIWFLITDLAATGSVLSHLGRKGKGAKRSKSSLSLYHFAPFKHWAVRVRDYCYEVNACENGDERYALNNKVHIDEWEKTSRRLKVRWEPIEVGATYYSDDAISAQAKLVWKDRCKGKYQLLSSNCQNFANCLYGVIALDSTKIDREIQVKWKRMPIRFAQIGTVLKRLAPALGRGLLIECLELTAEGAAVIGLEVLGMSLLGPVGEVILIISIIAPLILIKSKDAKWTKKLKQMMASRPMMTDQDMVEEYAMEQVIEEFAEEIRHVGLPPPYMLEDGATSATESALPELPPRPRYKGYDEASIDRYAELGFSVEHVIAVLQEWKIMPGDGSEFSFDEDDHRTMIECLMGGHGFDEVARSASVFTQTRKSLPKTAVTDHWANMIDTKLTSPSTKESLTMDTKTSTTDLKIPLMIDATTTTSIDIKELLASNTKASTTDTKQTWNIDTKIPMYDSKSSLKFEEDIRASLQQLALSCA